MNQPGLTHISLSVDDVDGGARARRRLRRRGARRLQHRRGRVRPGSRRPARRAAPDGVPPPPRRAASYSRLGRARSDRSSDRLSAPYCGRVPERALERAACAASRIAPSASSTSSSSSAPNCTDGGAGRRRRASPAGIVGRRRRTAAPAGSSPGVDAGSRASSVGGGLAAHAHPARALAVAVLRRARGVGRVGDLRTASARGAFVVQLPAAREHERGGVPIAEIALGSRRVLVELDEPGLSLRRLEAERRRRRRAAARRAHRDVGTAIRCAATTSDRSS